MRGFKQRWSYPLGCWHRKNIFLAVLNAFIIMTLNYCLLNLCTFFSDASFKFTWIEWVKNEDYQSTFTENPLFINVAYDKQLVNVYDEFGFLKGNAAITDRKKLYQLLQSLQSSNNYKYIFLDVNFQTGFTTPYDSVLFHCISRMERIVIACHPQIPLVDTSIISKSAIAGYNTSVLKDDISHFQYLWHGKISMPVFAYKELTGRNISSLGPLYFDGKYLCRNFQFLNFPLRDFAEYTIDGNKQIYQLGTDILEQYTENDLRMLSEGRYIIIGDYIEDVHNTYASIQPGPIILYQAFQALMNKKHFISIWMEVIQLILYTTISIFLFSGITINRMSKKKNIAYKIIETMLGYTITLSLFSILCFIIWGINAEIILPAFIFSIEKTILTHQYSQ